jgi:hypothetical protein
MFRRITSIAVGATAATALLVGPAWAGSLAPEGNGLAVVKDKPQVLVENIHRTDKFGKNELCRFPVKVRTDVREKFVITNGGDNVTQTARGKVKVTNIHTHESIRLHVDSKAYIKVSEDGKELRGKGYGNEVLLGDDIKVHSRRQGHVSAANRGHQENEGIYYFKHAAAKLAINNPDSENPSIRVFVKQGRVLDVCKALTGHHHHKKH